MSGLSELTRLAALDRVGGQGVVVDVVADEAERRAVAERLGIPEVTALACRFSLTRRADDPAMVVADVELRAGVVQVCVVSLEPFEAPVHERARLRFVPAGRESFDDDPEAEDEIPYEGSAIDLGEATIEQLALALDPYPRRPDATLADQAIDESAGPFAALRSRRSQD